MEKVIRVGKNEYGNLFVKIKFIDGKLSITGVEGPKSNGDCCGSCGQINMDDWGITEYAHGFDGQIEDKLRDIWTSYHLNDTQAGTPAWT